jgi:hypothetical protein
MTAWAVACWRISACLIGEFVTIRNYANLSLNGFSGRISRGTKWRQKAFLGSALIKSPCLLYVNSEDIITLAAKNGTAIKQR